MGETNAPVAKILPNFLLATNRKVAKYIGNKKIINCFVYIPKIKTNNKTAEFCQEKPFFNNLKHVKTPIEANKFNKLSG